MVLHVDLFLVLEAGFNLVWIVFNLSFDFVRLFKKNRNIVDLHYYIDFQVYA